RSAGRRSASAARPRCPRRCSISMSRSSRSSSTASRSSTSRLTESCCASSNGTGRRSRSRPSTRCSHSTPPSSPRRHELAVQTMSRRIAGCLIVALVLASAAPAVAQAPRPWLVPELLTAAKSEGDTLTIYASMNEEEALPYWAIFEQATGVKVNFVRMSDSNIRARIAIEHRAGQRSWDLVATTPVYRLGNDILAQFDPPQAKDLIAQARDGERRWYGYSGNYNTPAYNTTKVKPEELPKTYEEFLDRRQ